MIKVKREQPQGDGGRYLRECKKYSASKIILSSPLSSFFNIVVIIVQQIKHLRIPIHLEPQQVKH